MDTKEKGTAPETVCSDQVRKENWQGMLQISLWQIWKLSLLWPRQELLALISRNRQPGGLYAELYSAPLCLHKKCFFFVVVFVACCN